MIPPVLPTLTFGLDTNVVQFVPDTVTWMFWLLSDSGFHVKLKLPEASVV